MKLNYCLLLFMFSVSSFGQTYKPIPVIKKNRTSAYVMEVKKLSSKTVVENGKFGNFENRYIEITLGIKSVASACEKMKEVEYLPSQSSLASNLNPSDFYLRVNTDWEKGCGTGLLGEPEYSEFILKYSIDQRPISESNQPWPAPNFFANSNIRHLSFDSGMMGGYNRWKLYKLDYGDLSNVKFDYIKQYSYVQGTVVDH